MATTLHQQLKSHYVGNVARHEIQIDGYRIDAVDRYRRLIEIQCASLSAIRRKVSCLLESHRVIVAKPLVSRRSIVKLDRRNGEVISSRYSPLRQSLMHVFRELVHFVSVFPHPRLRLDVLLTEQQEIRIPPSGRTSRRRQYTVVDRLLIEVSSQVSLTTPLSLWRALDLSVPAEFTTDDLATASATPRWLCQKAAYCFRQMQFFEVCGKRGNALVYRLAADGHAEQVKSGRMSIRRGKAS